MKAILRPSARRLLVAAVLERDDWRCIRCGGWASIPHHRTNRGSGGSANPAIHFITNILAACPVCNGWFEDHPTASYEAGWKVRHSHNPAKIPVLYPDGLRWLLTADGGRRVVAHTEAELGEPA